MYEHHVFLYINTLFLCIFENNLNFKIYKMNLYVKFFKYFIVLIKIDSKLNILFSIYFN